MLYVFSVTVYVSQLCDNTTYDSGSDEYYKYCDDWWLTWYNCTTGEEQLKCNVNGYLTILPKSMECDGVQQCDLGEDEKCIVISESCPLTQYTRYRECRSEADCYSINICPLNILEDAELIACPTSNAIECLKEEEECEQNDDSCSKRNEHVAALKDNLKYLIPITKMCDGYQNCPTSTCGHDEGEETACTAALGESYRSQLVQRHGDVHFMPRCLPGIANQDCTAKSIELEAGVKRTLVLPLDDATFKCSYIGGDALVLAISLDLCDGQRNYTYSVTATCDVENATEVLAIATNDNKIVKVFKKTGDNGEQYFDGMFKCDNGKCISTSKVCDYIDDCADNSDEKNCTNTYTCLNTDTNSRIAINKTCDGVYDCGKKDDECGDQCKDSSVQFRIIISLPYRIMALVIGILSSAVNIGSIILYFKNIRRHKTLSAFVNDSFIGLIALGDLTVGVYMALLFVYDMQYGDTYCKEKWTWLSGSTCSLIGVLSTFGSQLSLLSMTCLSAFRIVSLKTMMTFADFGLKNMLRFLAIVVAIFAISFAISISPILTVFENYFVNGLYYEVNPLFTGRTTQPDFNSALQHWSTVVANHDDPKSVDWEVWRGYVKTIFNNTVNTAEKSVGFYGNDPVCLFKYFVRSDDNQFIFSIGILGLNLLCFIIITLCYGMIIMHTSKSSEAVGVSNQAKSNMNRLQKKVSIIILTDFVTWIPFIGIAFLHFAEVMDAEPYYTLCSIILIPINSVLNPVIYNGDTILGSIKDMCKIPLTRSRTNAATASTGVNMSHMTSHRGNTSRHAVLHSASKIGVTNAVPDKIAEVQQHNEQHGYTVDAVLPEEQHNYNQEYEKEVGREGEYPEYNEYEECIDEEPATQDYEEEVPSAVDEVWHNYNQDYEEEVGGEYPECNEYEVADVVEGDLVCEEGVVFENTETDQDLEQHNTL